MYICMYFDEINYYFLPFQSSSSITNESSTNIFGDQSSSISTIEKNMVDTNPLRSELKSIKSGTSTQEKVTEQIRTPIQNEINENTTPIILNTIRQVSSESTQNDREQFKTVGNNISYRNTDTHPDRLDYPAANSKPISPILSLEQVQHLSTETPLNSRYSSLDVSLQSNSHVNAELRSQLPWSYTNIIGKLQVPLKPQKQIYPEIPRPDYTT